MEKADRRLAPEVRKSWRWIILLLRAKIDSELYRNGGKLSGAELERDFRELTDVYHAQHALGSVRPPHLPTSR
jgi:hypothetical protein